MGALGELPGKLARGEAVVAGVISGTSADGIAVALARFGARSDGGSVKLLPPETLAFETRPFPPEVAGRVRHVLDGGACGLRETALLSRDLGRAFGRAVRRLADERDLAVDLAGSHGQTVYHHDGCEPSGRATLQLGDGDFVAEEAGCAVVSDFRQRDIASGGEGAPVSALADDLLFARVPPPAAILNLGGMANLTLLPRPGAGELRSFDTGPAGSLLDGLARRFLGRPFDQGGLAARAGRAHEGLVRELLGHEFLGRSPPKSTGRDTFGEAWVDSVVERARSLGVLKTDQEAGDLLASAADFVARAAALQLARFAPRETTFLVVCGGGAHNAGLMDALAAHSPHPVVSAADFGVHPEAREALVFAVLAARCALGIAVTRPSATGARAGRVLGKISLAPIEGGGEAGDGDAP